MANFLLLARGETINSARVVAVSADPGIVDRFLSELAGDEAEPEEHTETTESCSLQVLRGGEDG